MAQHSRENARTQRGAAPIPPAPAGAHASGPKTSGCRSCLIVGAVVIALLCLIASAFMRSTATDTEPVASPFKTGKSAQYDWDGLETINGRYAYYSNGTRTSRFGIDVSDSQGYIDWNAVANDGVEFAMVRCGYRGSSNGGLYTDEYFDYNIDSASAANINVGVYFFSQATSEEEAIEEAQMCLQLINGRDLQYPVAYDFEETSSGTGRADGIDVDQASANARAFCETIVEAGYEVMVYGNQHDLNDYDSALLDGYDIWYAEYGATQPTSNHSFSIWQYSNEGSIQGIDTVVDTNIDLTNAG